MSQHDLKDVEKRFTKYATRGYGGPETAKQDPTLVLRSRDRNQEISPC